MAATFQQFLARVATRQRVVLIGGLAVIAHGYSRPTKDGDAWLDPLDSPEAWAAALRATLAEFDGLSLWSLAERRTLDPIELSEAVAIDGVIRVAGLSADLDLFRKPNLLACEDFDPVWSRAAIWADEVRLIDAIDLILTKENTGREQDHQDIRFLEDCVRREFRARLAGATLAEARALFARYTDHVVCEAALTNPDPAVQALGREILRELAGQGDWFSREILARLEQPDPPAAP
jgi:hypothetical protein